MPLRVLGPRVGLEKRVLVVRPGLNLAPLAAEDVLARLDQAPGVSHGAPVEGVRRHAISMVRPASRALSSRLSWRFRRVDGGPVGVGVQAVDVVDDLILRGTVGEHLANRASRFVTQTRDESLDLLVARSFGWDQVAHETSVRAASAQEQARHDRVQSGGTGHRDAHRASRSNVDGDVDPGALAEVAGDVGRPRTGAVVDGHILPPAEAVPVDDVDVQRAAVGAGEGEPEPHLVVIEEAGGPPGARVGALEGPHIARPAAPLVAAALVEDQAGLRERYQVPCGDRLYGSPARVVAEATLEGAESPTLLPASTR